MSRRKLGFPLSGFDAGLLRLNDHAVRRGAAFAGRGTCGDQGSDGPLQCLEFARTTVALMIAASLLTIVAASWPWIEPTVFNTLGIVKKKAASPNG
jgi:hypothetical protein